MSSLDTLYHTVLQKSYSPLPIIAQHIRTCLERTPCIKGTLVRVLRVSAQYRFNCIRFYFSQFTGQQIFRGLGVFPETVLELCQGTFLSFLSAAYTI